MVITTIRGIDWMSGAKPQSAFPILVADLVKEDVPIGTEVWSLDQN